MLFSSSRYKHAAYMKNDMRVGGGKISKQKDFWQKMCEINAYYWLNGMHDQLSAIKGRMIQQGFCLIVSLNLYFPFYKKVMCMCSC